MTECPPAPGYLMMMDGGKFLERRIKIPPVDTSEFLSHTDPCGFVWGGFGILDGCSSEEIYYSAKSSPV